MAEAEAERKKPPLWAEEDGAVGLAGVRCKQCNTLFIPPQHYGCEACGADGTQLVDVIVPSAGTVNSFTTVYLHQTLETPYHVASVETREGPVVRGLLEVDSPRLDDPVVGRIRMINEKPRFVFVAAHEER